MVFDFRDGTRIVPVRLDEILGTKEFLRNHYELANVLRGEKLYREARSIYAKILNVLIRLVSCVDWQVWRLPRPIC